MAEVGDAVRVKEKAWASSVFALGVKLIVRAVEAKRVRVTVDGYGNSLFYYGLSEIEPWNDAEEWNGSEWVAKKPVEFAPKPAIVCQRENGKLALGGAVEHASTDAAFSAAQRAAELFPGKEYVVLQEKGSRRVEPKPKPKFKDGDFVRAVRYTSCDALETLVAKGQIVRVNGVGETLFTGSPLPANPCPALRIADFELVT